MEWDLGFTVVFTLLGMALGFGLLAQLLAGRGTTHWLWLIATAAYFGAGLLTSEAWFGWATEEELQPNIDGLSFDEVLLGGLIAGVAAIVITRRVTKRHSGPPA